MIICVFLKILCDCCIFFGIMGSMPDLFPSQISLIIPVFCCAASAAGACYFRKKNNLVISIIVAILPLLLFLSEGTVREKLILIPAVLYTVVFGILGRFDLDYYTFRKEYLRNIALLLIWNFLVALLPHLDMNDTYLTDVAFWFSALYLLSGVLLIQRLRMGDSCDKRTNWVQQATIIGSVSVVVGFSILIRFIMRLLVFFMGSSLIVEEIKKATGYYDMQRMRYELTKDMYPMPTTPPAQQEWNPYNVASVESHEEVAMEYRWMIIGAILCVLVLIAVVMLAKAKKHVHWDSEFEEAYEGSAFLFHRERKPTNRSNRSRIRKYYREYLRIERSRGMKLRSHMTSADILDLSPDTTDQQAAKQLRELYIIARYKEKTEISGEQVSAAKSALRRIRSSTETVK